MEKFLCNLCPRNCNVNRSTNTGFCGSTDKMHIAKVMLHFGEEPIITAKKGSGTIFFSGCNLKCCYCQNHEISRTNAGKIVDVQTLVSIFKKLETLAENINLVTPTHYSNLILEALKIYKPSIPVVYNTSGYEKVEIIEKLAPYVDIFLTDFKYFDDEIAFKYSKVKNYKTQALKALCKMVELKPNKIENGKMLSGVIVRHLILPSHTDDSIKILELLNKNFGRNFLVSLMSQYTPCTDLNDFPEINRKITKREYEKVLTTFVDLFDDGFVQELCSATTDLIPNFDNDILIDVD